jgi:alkanesulfonate monooxygenase SsuD/methylene tetrahydromethanopterin reductase-like flavin-dependent oxidoreductase (luciferase family)
MRLYRESFEPSEALAEPHAMVALGVIAADTDERATWLSGSVGLSWARIRTGESGPLPTPEEAAEHAWTPAERETADAYLSMQVVGGPERVRAGIESIVADTGADEVMITTHVHDHEARVHSYELVADAFGLTAQAA